MATVKMILLIATRNLWMARRRTLFLGVALSIVTTLLVVLMALSQGLSDNMIRSATTLTTGHINVAGFFKSTATDSAPLITNTSKLKETVKQAIPEVDYVVDRGRGFARVTSETGALSSLLAGVDITQEPQLLEVIEPAPQNLYKEGGSEQVLGHPKDLSKPDSAIIFATQAERLEVEVGDKITLRTQSFTGQANTVDVTIVAIARDIGLLSNFSIFVPSEVLCELYQLKPDTSGAVQIYLKDIDDSRVVMARLREVLEGEGYELMEYQPAPFFAKFETVSGEDWVGQKLDLTTWEDEIEFLTWILTALDTVSFGLIGILVAIIAIGVMNTMWISVRKRTTEIGTLRAVGMSRARVWWMFLLEALILGLLASLIGATVGVLIAVSVNALEVRVPVDAVRAILLSDTLHLSIDPANLFNAVATMTLFTTLSAMWPALKAARLQPVEAIQQSE